MKKKALSPKPAQPAENISRTRKKKDALALQELGKRLLELNNSQLAGLKLDEELLEAVTVARGFKSHEAFRRQLQYIGSLMRRTDAAPIQRALEKIMQGHSDKVRLFKQVEQWRDELLNGNDARLEWLISTYPSLEREKLAVMVQEARDPNIREHLRRKQARALFRYLSRGLSEE
jgi:ribosome-associated protein